MATADKPCSCRDRIEGVIPLGGIIGFLVMVLAVVVGLWVFSKVGAKA